MKRRRREWFWNASANTMTAVKVADLVTLTGGTRGSATMEIEASPVVSLLRLRSSIWVHDRYAVLNLRQRWFMYPFN